MNLWKPTLLGSFVLIAIYLFVSAPPPLETAIGHGISGRTVEVKRMFDTVDGINSAARTLYTKRIVGAGLKSGMKFGEDWAEPGVDKGPLPALFLRLVAAELEARPPRLGLYLGSDEPINKSNLFNVLQAETFAAVKADRAPHFATIEGIGQVGLYPDYASAAACVSCHNDHPDSPKTDWKLGDVMGATTWTFPDSEVGSDVYLAVVEALYHSIETSYQAYLAKVSGFQNPPLIGPLWPEPGLTVLPSSAVFMAEVRRLSAESVLDNLVLLEKTSQ
ncbi:MAG: DUF3365 domain-containing protein [Rhodobacterales bacterium]|jgi:adenylate cyclase|nr:hypothetical protein [Paracoccaceae bacterium]